MTSPEILDYSQWHREFRWKNDSGIWSSSITHSELSDEATGSNPFYDISYSCTFCQSPTQQVYRNIQHLVDRMEVGHTSWTEDSRSVCAYSCSCGWWSVHCSDLKEPDELTSTTLTVGILRRFPLDSLEAPLTVLRRYLAQKPDAVDYLHPTRMEQLVGALFQDFYPGCQVIHCGRTNDGGIDLFVVIGDVPVAVQVKRRVRTDKGEGVKAIRELLGAMLVAGVSRGIFVTTADHFTRQAKEAINQTIMRGAITYFDLIDRHRMFDLLGLVVPKHSESWRRHV